MNLNKVLLGGHLTRDPELRYTPKGTAVAKFSISTNRSWQPEGAQDRKEEVTFVDVTAWGRTAEVIGQYMKKGRPIFIEGRLSLEQWEDKTTKQKRSALRVVCESFQFVGSKPEGGTEPARPATRSQPAPSAEPGETEPPSDDDVPF